MSNTKQVLVIRKDLKMRRGKECSQAAHASVAFITRQFQNWRPMPWLVKYFVNLAIFVAKFYNVNLKPVILTDVEDKWLQESFAKVTLQVNSEQELLELYEQIKNSGLHVHLVTDKGLTEFNGVPTHTCIAVGPDLVDKIDPFTKQLSLY